MAAAYLALIADLDDGDWSYERSLTGEMHPWVNGDTEQILLEFGGGRVLVLHGANDMGFPVQVAERLHRALPGSELAIIKEAAHMCHFEKPRDWSDRIRSFVDRQ